MAFIGMQGIPGTWPDLNKNRLLKCFFNIDEELFSNWYRSSVREDLEFEMKNGGKNSKNDFAQQVK